MPLPIYLYAAPSAPVDAVGNELANARAGLSRAQEEHLLVCQQLPGPQGLIRVNVQAWEGSSQRVAYASGIGWPSPACSCSAPARRLLQLLADKQVPRHKQNLVLAHSLNRQS